VRPRLGDLIITASPESADPDATVLGSGVLRGVFAGDNGDGTCTLRRPDSDWRGLMPTGDTVIVPDHEFSEAEQEWVPLARAVVAERSRAAFHLPEAEAFARFIATGVLGILETEELPEDEDGNWHIAVSLDRELLGEYSWGLSEEGDRVFRRWFGRIPGLANCAAVNANRFMRLTGERALLDEQSFALIWASEHGPEGIVPAAA
jgi:hypothetical protein